MLEHNNEFIKFEKTVRHIYVFRHGETKGNVAGVADGQGETVLTELGELQAEDAGTRLVNYCSTWRVQVPDDWYASDSLRARQTSRGMRKGAGLAAKEPTCRPAYRERDAGAATGEIMESLDPQLRRAVTGSIFGSFPQGESMVTTKFRFFPSFVSDIYQGDMVLVTHKRVVELLLAHARFGGLSDVALDTSIINVGNGAGYHIMYDLLSDRLRFISDI